MQNVVGEGVDPVEARIRDVGECPRRIQRRRAVRARGVLVDRCVVGVVGQNTRSGHVERRVHGGLVTVVVGHWRRRIGEGRRHPERPDHGHGGRRSNEASGPGTHRPAHPTEILGEGAGCDVLIDGAGFEVGGGGGSLVT